MVHEIFIVFTENIIVLSYQINLTYNPLLKWSFTYKQHAWEPPQNHTWKIDMWPLQTEILKIKTGFAEKTPEKVDIITRTPAELRSSDFSLRFLT